MQNLQYLVTVQPMAEAAPEFPHNRIKELRESAEPKVEQYDLAAHLRCSTSTVCRLEAGHIPSKYIGPLRKRFAVSSDHLLGLDRIPAGAGGEARA